MSSQSLSTLSSSTETLCFLTLEKTTLLVSDTGPRKMTKSKHSLMMFSHSFSQKKKNVFLTADLKCSGTKKTAAVEFASFRNPNETC